MQTQLEGKALSRGTAVFVGLFLLAGVANLFSRQGLGIFGILLTCANYLILMGLLVFWIQSVRVRLLPSRGRTWVMSAAALMLTYQLLRTFKYRFAIEIPVIQYAIYLYFVPMTMIPALFLMTCVRIRRGNRPGRWHEALLLIPPGLLSLLALTNDLHGLVYAPKIDLTSFTVATGTYTSGPVFYLMYGWMILSLAEGLALLTRETRPKAAKRCLLCWRWRSSGWGCCFCIIWSSIRIRRCGCTICRKSTPSGCWRCSRSASAIG